VEFATRVFAWHRDAYRSTACPSVFVRNVRVPNIIDIYEASFKYKIEITMPSGWGPMLLVCKANKPQ
jgi:hypothetical protein